MKLSKIPSWVHSLLKDDRHKVFFITGGLGSGKTYGSAIALVALMLRSPGAKRWWVVAPTHTQAEDTILPTLVQVLSKYFGLEEGAKYIVYRSKPIKIFIKSTRQYLYLHSGDRPERMVAVTIGGYWITEAGIQKRLVFENCTARARDKTVKRVIGIIEGTPEGDGWYRDEADFNKSLPDRGYRRFVLHTEDNQENLSPDYITNLIQVYKNQQDKLASYLFGLFRSFNKGSAYWDFFESQNVAHDIEADPLRPIAMSWDFGVSPLAWIALQKQPGYYGKKLSLIEKIFAVEEATGAARGLIEACDEFRLRFPPEIFGNTPIELWGGHDGHFGSYRAETSAYTEIKNYLHKFYKSVKVCAPEAAPRIRERITRINLMFAYRRYMISSRCTNLIKSYNKVSLKPGTWDLLKPKDDPTHYSDAGDYGAFNIGQGLDLDGLSKTPTYNIKRV